MDMVEEAERNFCQHLLAEVHRSGPSLWARCTVHFLVNAVIRRALKAIPSLVAVNTYYLSFTGISSIVRAYQLIHLYKRTPNFGGLFDIPSSYSRL